MNSYKRLVAGYEAPVDVSWAHNNRSALVRLPVVKLGKSESTRLEYRAPDPACNPYLAFAVILAAGLEGIEEATSSPPRPTTNLFTLSPRSSPRRASSRCPRRSTRRSTRWSAPSSCAETLGEHVFEWFIRNKRERVGRSTRPR